MERLQGMLPSAGEALGHSPPYSPNPHSSKKTRDGCWLVPFTSWIWLLVVWWKHQYTIGSTNCVFLGVIGPQISAWINSNLELDLHLLFFGIESLCCFPF